MRIIRRIIVHHSASPLSTKFADIERWHVSDRKFASIGYNWVIEGDGSLVQGRSPAKDGAHCTADKANKDSIGICVVGNNTITSERWRPVQVESLYHLINKIYWVADQWLPMCGHRDVKGAATLCPGVNVIEVIANAAGDNFVLREGNK